MANDDNKFFIDAQRYLEDSFLLGKQILDSGFKPNFLVGIWRGGTFPGKIIQEFLEYNGVKTDHIAIRTSSYENDDVIGSKVSVYGLGYIVDAANANDKLLLVDDVFDRGLSVKAVLDEMDLRMRNNLPRDIRIATPYWKPEKNITDLKPDYFLHKKAKNDWLVFPHELMGLSKEEIKTYKGDKIANLFE